MLGESSKRAKLEEKEKVGPRGLPAGFFSSANRPVDEEEEDREDAAGPLTASAAMTSAPAPVPTGDAELDDFLASLAEPEPEQPEPTRGKVTATASRRGVPAYKDLIPGQASYEAAPVRIVSGEEAKEEETEPEESEAERRARLGREEREEIMGRLEEEERAQ
jgi:zinc finger protein 830